MVPIVPAAGFDEAAILRLAASVERSSEHPLADATVRAAGEWNLKLADVEEFDSQTGKGVIGTVDGKAALLGNAQFIVSSGIRTQSLEEQAEELRMPPANRRLPQVCVIEQVRRKSCILPRRGRDWCGESAPPS